MIAWELHKLQPSWEVVSLEVLYLPIMSDESLIVDKTGSIFLAGSYLVKAAIGEDIDNESLGGATTHSEISGVTDYKVPNDEAALKKIRNLIDKIGQAEEAGFNRKKAYAAKDNGEKLFGLLPAARNTPYDSYLIIEQLVDEGKYDEYKAGYGKTIITAYARIDGCRWYCCQSTKSVEIKKR